MPTAPALGVKPVSVGLGAVTVKLAALVAVPPGVVTAIGPDVAPAGTVAVICVPLTTVTPAEATPPKVTVAGTSYDHDIYIRADGKVKDRAQPPCGRAAGAAHKVGLKELEKVCKGGPEVLLVGAGRSDRLAVAKEGLKLLQSEAIALQVLPTPLAIRA